MRTKTMRLVMTTVMDLRVGDLLVLPLGGTDDAEPVTVEVTTLHRTRWGRIWVWVCPPHARRNLLRSLLHLDVETFDADDPIQRIEFQ